MRLIAIIMLLCITAAARGQGTGNMFPEPMSFDDMTKLLGPLQLSESQDVAVAAAHQAYLDRSLALRHGEMAEWLEAHSAIPLEFIEDRETIEDAIRGQQSIRREIRAIEDVFFADVAAIVADPQQPTLERVRARRARARLGTVQTSFLPGSLPAAQRLDLTSLVEKLEVDEAIDDDVDLLLQAYELAIQPICRSIHERRLEAPLAGFEMRRAAREEHERRIADLQASHDLTTEEGRMAFAGAMAELDMSDDGWFQAGDERLVTALRRDTVRLCRLGRQLIADLRGSIGEEAAADLLDQFARRALAGSSVPRNPVPGWIAKHREHERFAEAEEAINQVGTAYVVARRPLLERLIEAAEKDEFRRTSNWFRLGGAGGDDEPRPGDDQKEQLRELGNRTIASLAALIGEEAPKEIASGPRTVRFMTGDGGEAEIVLELPDVLELPEGVEGEATAAFIVAAPIGGEVGDFTPGSVMVSVASPLADEDGNVAFDMMPSMGAGGRWIAGPATSDDVADLVAALGVTGSEVIDTIHADYEAAYAALEESTITPARRAMAPFGPDSDVVAGVDKVRAAREAVEALDRALFEDVAIATGVDFDDPAIARSLADRARRSYCEVRRERFGLEPGSGSREARVDLAHLVQETLSGAARVEALAALDSWRSEVDGHFVQQWNQGLDAAKAAAERRSQMKLEGGNGMAFMETISIDDMEGEQVPDARARINESALADLLAAIAPVDGAEVDAAYHRLAFPGVYGKGDPIEGLAERARGLVADPETETAIDELLLDYRAARSVINDRLVARLREWAADSGVFDPERFRQFERAEQDHQADLFERTDLEERTRSAIGEIIGEPGREALGIG